MYICLPRRIVQALGESNHKVTHQYTLDSREVYWSFYKEVKIERTFLFLFSWIETKTEDVGNLYIDGGLPYFESENEDVCKRVDAANLKDIRGNPLKVVLSW